MLSEKCDSYKVDRDRMCEEKESLLAKLDQLKKKIETLEVRLPHTPPDDHFKNSIQCYDTSCCVWSGGPLHLHLLTITLCVPV